MIDHPHIKKQSDTAMGRALREAREHKQAESEFKESMSKIAESPIDKMRHRATVKK